MKILLLLMAALLLAASYPTEAEGSPQDEWLGIEGLRIVDVHHTRGYIVGMLNRTAENGSGWLEPDLPGQAPAPVAGIWTVFLSGEEAQRLDLTLYQADGEVFGEGIIYSTAGTNLVTAAGLATSNLLDLGVVTVGDPALIRLRLNLATSPAQGSYAAYTPSGLTGSGAATGGRTVLAAPGLATTGFGAGLPS
jgi:hypothetical protein